jgi:chromosome segregation ATPase
MSTIKSDVSLGLAAALAARDQQQAERAAKKRNEFLKLVEKQAAGDGHDPEKLLTVLDKMGIPVEEFQTAFEAQCDRLEWAELASHLDEHRHELADVRAKLREAKSTRDRKLEQATLAIESEFSAVVEKLEPIETDLRYKLDTAESALANLQNTAPVSASEKLDAACKKVRDAEHALREARKPRHRLDIDVLALMNEVRKIGDILGCSGCYGMERQRMENRHAEITQMLQPEEVDFVPLEASLASAEAELATVQSEFDAAAMSTALA